MSRILLIGGHGKVALLTAPLLVARGHEVDSVIRNPDHADDVRSVGAEPVVADVESMDVEALTDLARDHDAIVWSAGAGGGSQERTYAVDRDAAIRTMQAAEAAGVRRYVMVSYVGSGIDEVPEDNPFHHYAVAKAEADDHLRSTGLDWTVLGPSALTMDEGTGRIEITEEEATEVSRADVAAVVAEVLEREDTFGRTIRFNGGGTPIAQAISG
jgi:uncharacterized protein YbjT (DUF2867 family)